MKPFRRLFVAVLLVSVVAVAHAARLRDLHGLDDLKSVFNRDAGTVRLLLLVSPT